MAFRLLPEGEKCSVKLVAAQLMLALGTNCVTVSVVSHEPSPRGTESPSLPPAPASETLFPPVFAALPSPEAPPTVVLPATPSLPPAAATAEPALPAAGPPAPPWLSSSVRPQATTTSNTRDPRAAFECEFMFAAPSYR